ncbi:hypothetical protein [Chryseobacterium taichungense]|nr:hypothetical protein [Chryseobacterium taichungense]
MNQDYRLEKGSGRLEVFANSTAIIDKFRSTFYSISKNHQFYQ